MEPLINLKNFLIGVLSIIGGWILSMIGGWDMALQVLVIVIVMDYITGLTAAWFEQKLNSKVGFRGIVKKILLFVPVVLVYWLDQVLGTDYLRNMAILFYIANEGLSILENLGRANIPIPEFIKKALEVLRKQNGEEGKAE